MSTTTLTPNPDGKDFTIKGEETTFFGYHGALEMALGKMKEMAEAHDEKVQSPLSETIMELVDDLEIAADRITQVLENQKFTDEETKPYYEELIK